MSLAGWIGLGFIWLVLSCIIAALVTWSFQMRQPMHLGWATYDKDGTRHFGAVACFVFIWIGAFFIGCGIVNGIRLVKASAIFFEWLDGWFV